MKYTEGEGSAPTVIAKGKDLIAQRIKELAIEARVPLFEAPPLARILHKHVPLDREIPVELYSAVAEILAWVFQLRVWEQGQGFMPTTPTNLNIPVGLDPLESNTTDRQ